MAEETNKRETAKHATFQAATELGTFTSGPCSESSEAAQLLTPDNLKRRGIPKISRQLAQQEISNCNGDYGPPG